MVKLKPIAANDSNLTDDPILWAELSNMSILLEDYFTTNDTKVKVDKDNDKK